MQDFKRYKPYSIRLKHYNYSSSGEYFVTICTKDRINYFGEIDKNQEMALSEIGKVAEKYWLEIPKHFPNVELDIHQIMPNHIHGMIDIVETRHGASLRDDDFQNQFGGLQKQSLSAIINHFKGSVKRYANKKNIKFAWQPSYYDEIIINERHYSEVYTYILSNPQTWNRDRNNPKNFK
jgi:putative transposase